MKVHPLDDRILVKPMEAEEKTAGGIYIPDTAKEKPQRGTVEAVGRGKILDSGKILEPSVKKGDVVLYGKYSGTEIKVKGTEFVIIREGEILAIVE